MINNRQAGRRRGRGGNGNGQRPGGNPGRPDSGNRIDNRARGNANQLYEKYKNLARDAQMQGDRVNTEYYLQFMDHYFRVLSETRSRFEDQNQRRQRDDNFVNGFDNDFDDNEEYGDEGEPIRSGEQGDDARRREGGERDGAGRENGRDRDTGRDSGREAGRERDGGRERDSGYRDRDGGREREAGHRDGQRDREPGRYRDAGRERETGGRDAGGRDGGGREAGNRDAANRDAANRDAGNREAGSQDRAAGRREPRRDDERRPNVARAAPVNGNGAIEAGVEQSEPPVTGVAQLANDVAPVPASGETAGEMASEAVAEPRRRGRPRRERVVAEDAAPMAEDTAPMAIEADRLPPALSAGNDAGEPVADEPKPRRRRVRAAPASEPTSAS